VCRVYGSTQETRSHHTEEWEQPEGLRRRQLEEVFGGGHKHHYPLRQKLPREKHSDVPHYPRSGLQRDFGGRHTYHCPPPPETVRGKGFRIYLCEASEWQSCLNPKPANPAPNGTHTPAPSARGKGEVVQCALTTVVFEGLWFMVYGLWFGVWGFGLEV